MERIEDCISFRLGKAYQIVTQDARRRLAPYGVTPGQYALLKVLWEEDGQSGAALGERLRFDSATMTGLLDRLEKSDLLERRPAPHDRRINLVYLTPAGLALAGPLDREIDAMNAFFAAQFTARDAEQFRSLLAHLGRICEEAPAQE
jgi:DNA-binding MarR family transcriptional regulator